MIRRPSPSRGPGRRALERTARAGQLALWPAVLHLGAVTLAGALPPRPAPAGAARPLRMTVLVPAHDEEHGLPATLASLRAARPPGGGVQVVVVADHCTDATAQVAREAGVDVWERDRQPVRGKGAALRWALDRLLALDDPPDAVVVVDADSLLDADFLPLVEARLAAGADVVQGRYTTSPPERPTLVWRLTDVAAACQSVLRPRGRARLGAAAKLQGNGMVFRREVLQAVPWDAYGVSEDVGYWVRLLRSGVRPVHEPASGVRGAMPSDLAAARVQRARWEAGRREVAREHTRSALQQAAATRDPVLAEAVVSELVFPPLSLLAAAVGAAAALRTAGRGRLAPAGVAQAGVLLAHALVALRVSGAGRASYGALAAAPAVVGWKVAVKAGTVLRPQQGWVRTPRGPLDGPGRTPPASRGPSPRG